VLHALQGVIAMDNHGLCSWFTVIHWCLFSRKKCSLMFSASLSWSHFEGVEDKKEAISEAWQKLAWPWCGCQSNDWYRNWRRYAPLTLMVLICFNLSLRMLVQFERTRIFVAMQSMSQHESDESGRWDVSKCGSTYIQVQFMHQGFMLLSRSLKTCHVFLQGLKPWPDTYLGASMVITLW